MANSNKFKFQLNGMTFQLSNKHLQTTMWNGDPLEQPVIQINHVAGAAICKQYVKQMYPEVVVSVSSDSFSMGNSVDVYLSDSLGYEVDKAIAEDVYNFGLQFVYGKFNGMIDMYENIHKDIYTDEGTPVSAGVKYLSVNNRPKFCSLPDVVRMLRDMTTTESYVFGKISIEQAIEEVKGYGATQNNINKALKLI